MANGSEQARVERGRLLETAAAELAKSMGQQPDEIRDALVWEVRTLEQFARVKDFIVILAIKHVKERLHQHHSLSSLHESSSPAVPAVRLDLLSMQLEPSR
jgi:plasmid stabilization system protein ParE